MGEKRRGKGGGGGYSHKNDRITQLSFAEILISISSCFPCQGLGVQSPVSSQVAYAFVYTCQFI